MICRLHRTLSLVAAIFALLQPPPAQGDPLLDARVSGLERGLVGARSRLHDAPGRAAYDLRRTEARLRSLAVPPSQRGVAEDRLERDLIDLRHDADRLARRRVPPGQSPGAGPAVPDSYRPPYPEDIRGIERSIGVGKLVVLVQRSLRSSARELMEAREALAGRYLGRAEGDLARLAHLGPDPTLDALRREAVRLRARLGPP